MIFRRSEKQNLLNLDADEVVQVNKSAVGIFAASQTDLNIEDKVKQLFKQLREQVIRYLAATFGCDASEAEEITQEVFLELYKAFCDGKKIENVRAWIYRVAHNRAINQIKKQQFVVPVNDDDWLKLLSSLEDKGLNPEQILIQKEKLNHLRKAISRLTQIERECLNLRTKGFRYREIGEILKIGTTTVSDTLSRVVEKLARDVNG